MSVKSYRRAEWDPDYGKTPKQKKIVCKFTEDELKDIKNGLFMRAVDFDRALYWKFDSEKVKRREFTEALVAKVEKILEAPESQDTVEEIESASAVLESIKAELKNLAFRSLNESREQAFREAIKIIERHMEEVKK